MKTWPYVEEHKFTKVLKNIVKTIQIFGLLEDFLRK